MASLKEIRAKVTSIKSTQKITRAMQMVAASKMRRAQERMEVGRPTGSPAAAWPWCRRPSRSPHRGRCRGSRGRERRGCETVRGRSHRQ